MNRRLGRLVRAVVSSRPQRLSFVIALIVVILAVAGVAGAENYKY